MDELMQGERPLVPFGLPGRGLQPCQDHQMGWEEPAIGAGEQKAFYPPTHPLPLLFQISACSCWM